MDGFSLKSKRKAGTFWKDRHIYRIEVMIGEIRVYGDWFFDDTGTNRR